MRLAAHRFAFTAGSRYLCALCSHLSRSRRTAMDEAPARDSAAIERRLAALASALRGGTNPFLHDPEMLDLLYGINGFGMNWLAAETGVPGVREVILDRL